MMEQAKLKSNKSKVKDVEGGAISATSISHTKEPISCPLRIKIGV